LKRKEFNYGNNFKIEEKNGKIMISNDNSNEVYD